MKYRIQKILFSPKTQTFHAELEPLEKPIKGFCIDYPEGKVIDIEKGLENRCKTQAMHRCTCGGMYEKCYFGVKDPYADHCKHYLPTSMDCACVKAMEEADNAYISVTTG